MKWLVAVNFSQHIFHILMRTSNPIHFIAYMYTFFNSFTTMLSYTENLIGFDSTIFCMIFKQNNTIFSFAAWKQTNNTNTTTLFNIFIYLLHPVQRDILYVCVSASVFLFLFFFFALARSKHKWTKREQSWNNLLPFTWALINYEHNKS